MGNDIISLNSIWIIVPFIATEEKYVSLFIDKHRWFTKCGGNLIFKASGNVDAHFIGLVKESGSTIIQSSDSSLYEAWNQSMDYLQDLGIDEEDYITFLGLDDLLCQDFCVEVVNLANKSRKIDFIYGNHRGVLNGKYRDIVRSESPALFGDDNYSFDVSHPGMMNRWGTVREQRFDLQYKLAADFDFYIGIAQKNVISFVHVQKVQAVIGADGVSNNANAKAIYFREWKLIAMHRNVKLDLQIRRMKIMMMISILPCFFKVLRKLYWLIVAKKI